MPLKSTNIERLEKLKADIKLLQLDYPVAHIARMTGMDGGNVSAYLSGKKQLGQKVFNRFYKVLQGELKRASVSKLSKNKVEEASKTELELLRSIDNRLASILDALNNK